MPGDPRITATGGDASVRPYTMRDNSALMAAEDAGLMRADALSGGRFTEYGPARDYYMSRLPDRFARPSVVDEDLGWLRAEMLGGGELYGSDIAKMARETSRQARITSASRTIENAPYAAAERATAAEQDAQLTTMRIEERQAQEAAAVEARADEIAAEKIAQSNQLKAAQNESLRLAQEQQALTSGLPIGPTVPFGKKPMVSTPTGQAVAPAARTALGSDQGYIGAKVEGLIGNYSQNRPTYTEAKAAGNVGTIDLRADAPKPQEIGGEDYLMQAATAAAQRGDMQTADAFSKIAKVSAETAKLRAETSKTRSDEKRGATTEMKEEAEAIKAYAETDKLLREIAAGDKPVSRERMMISGGQAAEQLGKDLNAVVEAEIARDTSYMAATTPEERSAIRIKHRADALRYLQSDPIRAPLFKMVDMLSLDLDSDQAAANAKNGSTTSAKSPTDLEDIWTAK